MVKTVFSLQLEDSELRTLASQLMNIIITSVSVLHCVIEAQTSPSVLTATMRLTLYPIGASLSVFSAPRYFHYRTRKSVAGSHVSSIVMTRSPRSRMLKNSFAQIQRKTLQRSLFP